MARTTFVVSAELSLVEERLTEWTRPLFNLKTNNRLHEFSVDDDIYNSIDDVDEWQNTEYEKLGNSNNFTIFELGLDSGFHVIRNSYEIGNESFITTEQKTTTDDDGNETTTDELLLNTSYWELNLISDEGIASDEYSDKLHLTPYYPNNVLKYANYADINFDSNDCNFYKNKDLPDFDTADLYNNDNIITITSSSNNIGSLMPIITPTYLGDNVRVNDFVKANNYDISIRREIYIAYCASKNWWKDDDGEIASWYKDDQGDYTGKYKVCSSWQIYEWLLEEQRLLTEELEYLNSRTIEQIEDGLTIGQLINGAGLNYTFDQMFSEYPGVYTKVLIQFGYYEFTGDESLNKNTDLFQRYGYREITDIADSFESVAEHYGVYLDVVKEYFSVSQTIDLSGKDSDGNTATGTVKLYRLNREKFMLAGNKYQYFISVYFLGLYIEYDSPCEYDQVIIFIILVVITVFTLGSGTPYATGTFAAYAAEFVMLSSLITMWGSFLGMGSSDFIKALSIATALFGGIDSSTWVKLAITSSLRGIQLALAIENMQSKNESDEQFKETEVREEELRKVQTRLRSENEDSIRFMPFDTMMNRAEIKYNPHEYLTIFDTDYKEKYGEQF